LIDKKQLTFNGEDFEVNGEGSKVDVYEVDDFLGHFEDLGVLNEQTLIGLLMIYELFDYYIETCWENKEIQKYIKQQRSEIEGGVDIYDKFEYIYNKCRSYGAKKKGK
jgi:hypothetical protein